MGIRCDVDDEAEFCTDTDCIDLLAALLPTLGIQLPPCAAPTVAAALAAAPLDLAADDIAVGEPAAAGESNPAAEDLADAEKQQQAAGRVAAAAVRTAGQVRSPGHPASTHQPGCIAWAAGAKADVECPGGVRQSATQSSGGFSLTGLSVSAKRSRLSMPLGDLR